ncbi:hypothetical protein HZZ00_17780 [Streptomyces sp. NEAU-sy36]|uniref:carbonic anhydrase n=1 Tax=unclassified Streptomyces TaxID=2593676 RepID=UPI0015D60302|nr:MULTISPECIES: hypothetical protein [unclassified Streptomyces]QLJ02693.1 hypothetical protein HZZ00_17780 [Streptomyces sp. NEAU-sy36]
MQTLIDNARDFGRRPEEFARPAAGQSPEVLFITCSGARVVPALITGARPGRLFELRTRHTARPARPRTRRQCPVLIQLLRLRSYPCVERALARDRLTLRGWYYQVDTGAVRTHRPTTDTFESL